MKSLTNKIFTNINTKSITQFIVDAAKVILGGALLGLAYSKWMVPNEIINGGATSLSLILQSLTGLDVMFYTQVLTLGFLALSLIFLGSKNLVLSIVSSLSYTMFFSLFYKMQISLQINVVVDVILACFVIALGYYLCLSAGASTVGVEVIALIIHKKNDKYDLIKLMRLMNYSVLAGGFFIYGFKSVFIGILFSYGYSAILKVLMRLKKKEGLEHEQN